ncbi:Cuticle protein CP14.6 [Amphibalanus amphitrite]|uniref:Cuticle protein CP14.6 n=1 Tax=Amphibalanus amphitrite TaxID=1232801 RepID=A0A6A4W741_AMPAM|nr:larval cuticle protein 65Ag1-like [Amphibalanus amphitrite]KAF0299490.1 Cuticle protein CP14.6 [Amphibalanus amphitrite]
MKTIVFAALLAVAVAIPQQGARIISQRFDMDQQGNYEYGYQQDDGTAAEQVGRVQRGPEPETGSLTQQGSYTYVGDDGVTYTVAYIADQGGFQPQASHLPVAPAQLPEYDQLRQQYPQLF